MRDRRAGRAETLIDTTLSDETLTAATLTDTPPAAAAAAPVPPPAAFRALSARLGADPLQVQGPGGNTSVKASGAGTDGVMWIKASGTELADAEARDIFVAVDVARARDEVAGAPGADGTPLDGTCRAAMLDPASPVRPSIETTFHAALDAPVVLHTHSVATLAHAVSAAGTAAALAKLDGMDAVTVPYAKPGLPLTRAILKAAMPGTRVFVLRNHGLVVTGDTVRDAATRIAEVERRLDLPARDTSASDMVDGDAFECPPGWEPVPWAAALAGDLMALATAGTLYPDHAVFLGPGMGVAPGGADDRVDASQWAAVVPGRGAMVREGAGATRLAMLRCLIDVIARVPAEWGAQPIGAEAEAALMNWDAETYRQKLSGVA